MPQVYSAGQNSNLLLNNGQHSSHKYSVATKKYEEEAKEYEEEIKKYEESSDDTFITSDDISERIAGIRPSTDMIHLINAIGQSVEEKLEIRLISDVTRIIMSYIEAKIQFRMNVANSIMISCINNGYWRFVTTYLHKEMGYNSSFNHILNNFKKHRLKIYLYRINFLSKKLMQWLKKQDWPAPTEEEIKQCDNVSDRYKLRYIQSLMDEKKSVSNAAFFHMLNTVYLSYKSRKKELKDMSKSHTGINKKRQIELKAIPSILSSLANKRYEVYKQGFFIKKWILAFSTKYYEDIRKERTRFKKVSAFLALLWGAISLLFSSPFVVVFFVVLNFDKIIVSLLFCVAVVVNLMDGILSLLYPVHFVASDNKEYRKKKEDRLTTQLGLIRYLLSWDPSSIYGQRRQVEIQRRLNLLRGIKSDDTSAHLQVPYVSDSRFCADLGNLFGWLVLWKIGRWLYLY